MGQNGTTSCFPPAVGLLLLLAQAVLLATGCTASTPSSSTPSSPKTSAGKLSAGPASSITLATTTSTQDSGLLDALLPQFTRATGIEVKVVEVGSGQALELGRRGDADVLLTHSPEPEERFVAEGYGTERRLVMYNDFVLVGPPGDPAGIARLATAAEALRQIATSGLAFVSRGDESGTHAKERTLWQEAGLRPEGGWYLEGGAGMAQTLRLASERGAYTLSDRATFLAQGGSLDLEVAFEGDPALRNQYAVIPINPARHTHLDARAVGQFADFLVSPDTQRAIGEFGKADYGEPLFFPNAAGN